MGKYENEWPLNSSSCGSYVVKLVTNVESRSALLVGWLAG